MRNYFSANFGLKGLIYSGLASMVMFGCEQDKPPIPNKFLEGEVIDEARVVGGKGGWPYAFTLKDSEGKFHTFDVGYFDAAGVDSLINVGDIIKIDYTRGVDDGLDGKSLRGTNHVEIMKKAEGKKK